MFQCNMRQVLLARRGTSLNDVVFSDAVKTFA